jgi:cytochrome oxidase Cu insertion factor (SCO1/SenC/PrrC family)
LSGVLQSLDQTLKGKTPPVAAQTAGPEVGDVAPEIEGEDIDGVPFKLSDYRGQVVVLDFWGDW